MPEANLPKLVAKMPQKQRLELADRVSREAALQVVENQELQLIRDLEERNQNVFHGNRRPLVESEVERFLEGIALSSLPTEETLEWFRKRRKLPAREWRENAMALFRNLVASDDGL